MSYRTPRRKYGRVVVVNNSGQVIGRVSAETAVSMIFSGKMTSLKDSESTFSSRSGYVISVPEIAQINKYTPYIRREVKASKHRVHVRDNWVCAYCGNYGDTIDHIIPQAKGGQDTWENMITACGPCNTKKGDRTLEELGWTMGYAPGRYEMFGKEQEMVNEYFASALVSV